MALASLSLAGVHRRTDNECDPRLLFHLSCHLGDWHEAFVRLGARFNNSLHGIFVNSVRDLPCLSVVFFCDTPFTQWNRSSSLALLRHKSRCMDFGFLSVFRVSSVRALHCFAAWLHFVNTEWGRLHVFMQGYLLGLEV